MWGTGSSLGMSWTPSQTPASPNSQVPRGNAVPGSDTPRLKNHSNFLGQGVSRAFTRKHLCPPAPLGYSYTSPGQIIHCNGKHLKIPRAAQVPTTNSLLRAKFNPLSDPALGISLSIAAGEAISWLYCLLHTPLTTSSNFSTSAKKYELVKDPAASNCS